MNGVKVFFQKLKIFLQGPRLDPVIFDDPIALQVSWKPFHRGGNRGQNQILQQDMNGNWYYEPTTSNKLRRISNLIYATTVLLFAYMFMMGIWDALEDVDMSSWQTIVNSIDSSEMVIIAVFCLVSVLFVWMGIRVLIPKKKLFYVFNVMTKSLYQVALDTEQDRSIAPVDATNFADVHALQIIDESVRRSKNNHYTSYEINLILHDATRINIADHGNYEAITIDAHQISELLDVPVWNAIAVAQEQYDAKFDEIRAKNQSRVDGFISGDDDIIQ